MELLLLRDVRELPWYASYGNNRYSNDYSPRYNNSKQIRQTCLLTISNKYTMYLVPRTHLLVTMSKMHSVQTVLILHLTVKYIYINSIALHPFWKPIYMYDLLYTLLIFLSFFRSNFHITTWNHFTFTTLKYNYTMHYSY